MSIPVPSPLISCLNFLGMRGMLKKRRNKGSLSKGSKGLATSCRAVTSICTTAGIVCLATCAIATVRSAAWAHAIPWPSPTIQATRMHVRTRKLRRCVTAAGMMTLLMSFCPQHSVRCLGVTARSVRHKTVLGFRSGLRVTFHMGGWPDCHPGLVQSICHHPGGEAHSEWACRLAAPQRQELGGQVVQALPGEPRRSALVTTRYWHLSPGRLGGGGPGPSV